MEDKTRHPSGKVTFLFTDIEGSTRLWERSPLAMRKALERHDRILGGLIEDEGGYVFKTVGDAFCASFSRPAEALRAARKIQAALAAEEWGETPIRVRMGIHSGEAEERAGDYFGPPVNRVARIMAMGAGGQILVSSATRMEYEAAPDPDCVLLALGTHRLKDLRDPEELWQLSAPGLPADFPPLKGLDHYHHNLPVQLSSFIGREREVARIVGLAPGTRLLTLAGPGGCGKTRLALQAAGELLDVFPEGLWFIDLSAVSDPYLLPAEVASVLGIGEEVTEALPARIGATIGERSILLVIDNCEHLVAAVAELVGGWLRACPGLRIVATSREPLRLPGELLFQVEPLVAPDPAEGTGFEAAAANECVRLFEERATAANPGFRLGSDNIGAVMSVCARLDGVPLAIELAAARTRVLSPEQILARLDDRFRLLTGGNRGTLPRQQTLRDLIGWSYDLLSPAERALFRVLSVFASGWDLEAAEEVCAGEADGDILDLLEDLVVKSLVVVEESAEGSRFRMLESIRGYAALKLGEEGSRELAVGRHAAAYRARASFLSARLRGPGEAQSLASMRREAGNFIAALDHFVARGEVREALALACDLEWFQYRCRRFSEAQRCLESAIGLAAASPDGEAARLRARALVALGWCLFAQGNLESARDQYSRGVEECHATGETASEARGLTGLGVTVRWLGDRKAGITLAEEGVAAARRSGDVHTLVYALIWAYATTDGYYDGEPPVAALEEALSLARGLGDFWAVAHLLDGIGDLHRVEGRHAEARKVYDESLRLFRELGDHFMEAFVLDGLAKNEAALGDAGAALPLFQESLVLVAGFGMRDSVAESFAWLAYVARLHGDLATSARLFGNFAATARPEVSAVLLRRHAAIAAARETALRDRPADYEEGRRMAYPESLRLATALSFA